MKVSLNTVKQFTKVDLSVDELVQRINAQLGHVEAVIDLSAKYKDAVIVKVLSAVKHENADKLSVCVVDDGGAVEDVERDADGHVQVVCGAPNVHADMLAIWLPPGSTVPASYDDKEPFVLAAREIRGVTSNGMLAAADELAIGTDHDGIIEINLDEWRPYDVALKPGTKFAEAYGLNDTVIDIENKMFTHRPDLFGQLGVAREIAGIQQQAFTSPAWYLRAPVFAEASGLELTVTNDVRDKVPRFMAVAMKNIDVKPSPLWLQCALVAMGGKPINNIVDVTNYIMLLTAQPTHAYDYDKLRGHVLGTRMAKAGEQLPLLNGKTYTLEADDIVIVDGEGPVGLGGIMGGGNSEVSADTKNIVLEVANFDMYIVRRSSMRHGLFTDALTRFNKGQSPLQNDRIIALLMQSVFDVAGGSQASNVYDEGNHESRIVKQEIDASTQFINARLGLTLDVQQTQRLLENVEFTSTIQDSSFKIQSPFWRTDIVDPEDIVEEVGRLYGFDKLPQVLPERSIVPAAGNPLLEMKRKTSQILSGAGGNEVKTYSFVHERVLQAAGQNPDEAYRLSNALSPDLQYYRLSLTPSLLEHVHANIKAGHDQFALYEFGKAHHKGDLDDAGLPVEYGRLAFVYAARKQTQTAYYMAQRYVTLLSQNFRFEPVDEEKYADHPAFMQLLKPFDMKRSALVYDSERLAGVVGEYAAATRRSFKLPDEVAGFELFESTLLHLQPKAYIPLSRFPRTAQDISLKVTADTHYAELYAAADTALADVRNDHLRLTLSPLGIYQPEGGTTKTVTLRLTAAHYERTLTDAEVTTYIDSIANAAAAMCKAEKA